jgi:hypothetical protein
MQEVRKRAVCHGNKEIRKGRKKKIKKLTL